MSEKLILKRVDGKIVDAGLYLKQMRKNVALGRDPFELTPIGARADKTFFWYQDHDEFYDLDSASVRALSRELLYDFRNEYLQIPTESREQAAVRELAEHCVDLIDDYEDTRCRYKSHGSGIPVTPEEREDCRRYAEDVKEELHWFARLLIGIEKWEWQREVFEAMRQKARYEDERRER